MATGSWAWEMLWYLIGVPLVMVLHCWAWFALFGVCLEEAETGTASVRWYAWKQLLCAILSFPCVLPGNFLLVIPLRWICQTEERTLGCVTIINGTLWGVTWTSLIKWSVRGI